MVVLCQNLKTKKGIKTNITGKINLNIYGSNPKSLPEFGDIIEFKSSIKSIRNFMNPGAFDYRRFLKFKGIYGSAYANSHDIKILTSKNQSTFINQSIRRIEKLRTGYYAFILNQSKPSDAHNIIISLITGKKEVISPDVRDLFSKAGISHLLAISGLHLSIVTLLFFYLFYRFLSGVPTLLISGNSRKIAGVLTIIPLAGYAVFSGFSPSTQRAFIMTVVLLLSFVCEKEKDIISSLSLAGIIILLLDSSALFSISFQLSFFAVVFIVCGLSLLNQYSLKFKNKFLHKIAMLFCVTVFAGIGTLPLAAHYFNVVSFVQVITNLIAIPIIGFTVLPLGIIILVCFQWAPILAGFVTHICTQFILFVFTICDYFVSFPYSWSSVVTLQWQEISVIYLLAVSIFLFLKGQRKNGGFLFVLALLVAVFNFQSNYFKKPNSENINITIIDVGQGNSALIQTPDNKNILVDGGGFSGLSSFDTGRFIVAPFLWQKRIRSLDYVILSHPESDHLNGLIFILQNFKVHTLIKNTDVKNSKQYRSLVNICKTKAIKIWNPFYEEHVIDLGKTNLIFYDSSIDNNLYDMNNNSLVFKVLYQDFSMLFTSDILRQREKKLSEKKHLNLHANIMQSPHHGSATSSNKFFLDKVQPKSVIISCGWRNRYGFPHYKVLKRYKEKGANIFRTDKDGAIFISSDGNNYYILTYKDG
ncbi:MAG: DNA internalization-related competence protein ComEC/Rec2 [Desulfobacteraceae bacterium]|nr:DNA internalization-related competence protein ComEC/Rec2 [Desulfobacteraceae bacterium]